MQVKGRKAIQQVAKMQGVPEEYVRENIRLAILDGYNKTETRRRWAETFGEGVLPTPEEFIITIAEKIKNA